MRSIELEITEGIDEVRLRNRLDHLVDEYGLDNILSQLEDICRDLDGYDRVADELKTSKQGLEMVDEELTS